jgi:hypothetical protein
MKTHPARCGTIWQGSWSFLCLLLSRHVFNNEEDKTVKIMDDAAIVDPVSSPPKEEMMNLSQKVSPEAFQCIKK